MNWMYWLAPALMIVTAFLGLRIRQTSGRPPGRGFRAALISLMLATLLEASWGFAWNWEMSQISRSRRNWDNDYSTLPTILMVVGAVQIVCLVFGTVFFVRWVIHECEESIVGAPAKTPPPDGGNTAGPASLP